jgi:hypothetical protein
MFSCLFFLYFSTGQNSVPAVTLDAIIENRPQKCGELSLFRAIAGNSMAWRRAAALVLARGRGLCAFVWLPALKNAAISKLVENSQHCGGAGGAGGWLKRAL